MAICDLVEDTVANEEKDLFPRKWRQKGDFTSDLVGKFGPLEDHMVDYAVDFLGDAVGSRHLAPAAAVPRPKGRRSRAKLPLTLPSPGGRAPDFAVFEAFADLDVDDGGLPSDLEDRFGHMGW